MKFILRVNDRIRSRRKGGAPSLISPPFLSFVYANRIDVNSFTQGIDIELQLRLVFCVT